MTKGVRPPGLVMWKPGQSGNPAGRPKGSKNRSVIAKAVLHMKVRDIYGQQFVENLKVKYPALTDNVTIEELGTLAIANKMIIEEDTVAYKELMDSAYGKSKEVTEEQEQPVVIQVQLSKEKDLLKNQKIE